MQEATVLDAAGRRLSSTSGAKARQLVEEGKALLVAEQPLTIRLNREIGSLPQRHAERQEPPGRGQRVLLHICCAPCSTYTVQRLRELTFDVTGYWYNPNVHPYSEHQRRRETLAEFARQIALPVIWAPGYELVDFLRDVCGQEQFRVRCKICYRMRLERTALVAAREGFDAFTTTLLISPYQDLRTIAAIGDEIAARYGLAFFFENLRRGWAEHFAIVQEHDLYSQRYCGCVYSEWEALDRGADTLLNADERG